MIVASELAAAAHDLSIQTWHDLGATEAHLRVHGSALRAVALTRRVLDC